MNNPNFPNMMANGMRPQLQMQQIALNHYRNQQPPAGWQQACPADERARLANQISTYYRLLKPDAPDQEVIAWGIRAETERFLQSTSKEEYISTLKHRFVQLQQARQRNADMAQQGNNLGQQQMMMGQGNLQIPRPNQQPQMPQGFPNPQLQRPMQASPIPMNPSQSSMGNENPNQFGHQQPAPQPNMQRGPQQGQPNVENERINALAQRLMQSATPEQKEQYKLEVMKLTMDKRQQLAARNIDPLFFLFRQQAAMMYSKQKQARLQQGAQANMQGSRPMQPGQGNQMPGQQLPTSQGQLAALNGQDFDYAQLAGQQAEALRVQDQGQVVVPASNNLNANPAMGAFGPNGATQAGQPSQTNQGQNGVAQQRQAFVNAQAQAQVQAQNHARNVHAQAQAQARAHQAQQVQQQAVQAQAQAQAHASQAQSAQQMMLRGQVGGLNMPQGPQQSPAMPFLTRPMVPPGQQGGSTPQQRPQAHVPQMTPQAQPQIDPRVLAQQAQERAAAAQGQPMTHQQRAALLPPQLPPQARTHLMSLNDEQFRSVLSKISTANRNPNAAQNPAFPANTPQMNQNGMPTNPQAFAMNLQNQQFNNAANLNLQQQMRLAQQNPGAMTPQQAQLLQQHQQQQQQQQQRVQAANTALRRNPQIINETDSKPFPQNLLNATIRQHIPPEIKSWAQLKEWASRNPNLAPNFDAQKLMMLQVMHFLDNIQQQQRLNGQQGPPQPNNNAVGATPQPGGPAPLARMVSQGGPQPPMQARNPPQMMPGLGSVQPPTAQELQFYRQKLNQAQSGVSDDQLRHYIMQQRVAQAQKLHAQQHQQMQGGQTAQPPMQTQPPQQTPRPPMPPAQPSGTKLPNRAPQPPPKAVPQPQNGNKQGLKRGHDETIDLSNSGSTTTMPAPQAPTMVPTRSQPGAVNVTPEQMRAQQLKQAQAQALSNRTAQPQNGAQAPTAGQGNNPQADQRFQHMLQAVNGRLPREAPKVLSPADRAQMQQWIKEHYAHIKKTDACLKYFMVVAESTEGNKKVLESMMETRLLIWRQLTNNGLLADQVTVTKEQFQKSLHQIVAFISKVAPRLAQAAHAQQGPASQQQQQQSADVPQSKQAQLNAANLKIVNDQANHQRQHNLKAPPAPTTDRAPFQLGAQSPRGAPQYYSEPQINPNNLKIPQKKKQKLDSVANQTSTPAPTSSPHVGSNKGASPDLKRQQQPEKPTETKPSFKCKDTSCDFSVRGFDTQAELETHMKDAHPKVDDPLMFALESLRGSLGLDKDGKEKAPKANVKAVNRGIPAGKVAPQAAKPGQTPAASTPVGAQSAATPMARVATQTSAMRGSPSTNLLRTPQTSAKVATPSTGQGARSTPTLSKSDLKDTFKAPEREKTPEEDSWASSAFDPVTLKGLIDSMDIPGMRDDAPKLEDNSWIPRSLETLEASPATTPASSLGSKDSTSTRDSDISELANLQINVGFDPDVFNMGDSLPEVDIYDELRALGLIDDDSMDGLGLGADEKKEPPVLSWENTFGKMVSQEAEGGIDGWGGDGVFAMS